MAELPNVDAYVVIADNKKKEFSTLRDAQKFYDLHKFNNRIIGCFLSDGTFEIIEKSFK